MINRLTSVFFLGVIASVSALAITPKANAEPPILPPPIPPSGLSGYDLDRPNLPPLLDRRYRDDDRRYRSNRHYRSNRRYRDDDRRYRDDDRRYRDDDRRYRDDDRRYNGDRY